MEFFDTSVLIAASWGSHPHQEASIKLLGAANKKQSACAIHKLAEAYAVMTVLAVKPMLPPEQVLLFVQEIRDRLSLVAPGEAEYFATIKQAAERGFAPDQLATRVALPYAICLAVIGTAFAPYREGTVANVFPRVDDPRPMIRRRC